MSETFKATGSVVNLFKKAVEHPTKASIKLWEEIDFAHANMGSGFNIVFNKTQHLGFMGAFVPMSLLDDVREREGQQVECEWTLVSTGSMPNIPTATKITALAID